MVQVTTHATEAKRLLVLHDVPRVQKIVTVSIVRNIHLLSVWLENSLQPAKDFSKFVLV